MDVACEAEIGQMMEVLDRKDIGAVIRVIPEPQKDIGFNILAAFHYKRPIQTVAFASMEEAVRFLSSQPSA